MKLGALLVGFLLAACGPQPPISDAEIIAALEADRVGYAEIIDQITALPIITRASRSRDGTWSITPGVDANRARMVTDFLDVHGLTSISADPDGPRSVRFVFDAQGLGVSGRMKSLDYGPVDEGDIIVADTDVEMAKPSERWRVASRRIDGDWYIRHACC